MFVSVLINNYNYGDYLEAAVASVLGQSHQDFEIILVDDGSQDRSPDLIKEFARRDSRLVPCLKDNGGQLSAFNAGYLQAQGEVLFFLDADDVYHADYLEKALAVYREHTRCDFLFCGYECFGNVNEPVLLDYPDAVTDLGYTGLLTYHCRTWIGAPTSTLSLRRSLAQRFFPIPFEEDWRIRADDCLVWLASLYNGRKFCLNAPCLGYRTHGSNHFFGRAKDRGAEFCRNVNAARLVARVAEDLGQYRYLGGEELARFLLKEAATGQKNRVLLKKYAPLLKSLSPKSIWPRNRKLARIMSKAPLP